MPDACFDDPRLAAVYDALDPDRSDLDPYVAMVAEFGAGRVLDVGCGTGTFAVRLARRGAVVTGVDPAAASIAVARHKPWADGVEWFVGDVPAFADRHRGEPFDLAVMTANVAQVFVTDESWERTLRAIHRVLTPGGRLVFETRDPARRAWERWSGPAADVVVPGVGRVSDSYEVTEVTEPSDGDVVVTFSSPTRFHGVAGDVEGDDLVIGSMSTLRFRTLPTLRTTLADAGFTIDDVRDAPDRPGAEWVIIARR